MRHSCMTPDDKIIDEICNEYCDDAIKDTVRETVTKTVQRKNEEFLKTHKPIYEIENYKVYHRHLIQLRPEVAMLIHIFQRSGDDNWESIWLKDNENYQIEDFECIKESARQLILQLEGHWCDLFITSLRDECNKIIKANNKALKKLKKNDTNRNELK